MIIIILLASFSYLALLVHGNVPTHYFVTVAPLFTIIIAYLLSKLKINIYMLLVLLILLSSNFYISKDGFYKEGNYDKQIEVVKKIIKDANGRKFNLSRVGDFDYYSDNYSQNYQYLLWLYGNEPSKDKQVLKYTIYDKNNDIYFK